MSQSQKQLEFNLYPIDRATQAVVVVMVPLSNLPKYINIYKNQCSIQQQDITEDPCPWGSALIASLVDYFQLNLSQVLAKKNAQMQLMVQAKSNYYNIAFVIPPQMSLIMKTLSLVRKCVQGKRANDAISRLKHVNKEYFKKMNKEETKKNMLQVVQDIQVNIVTKNQKSMDKEKLKVIHQRIKKALIVPKLESTKDHTNDVKLTNHHLQDYIHSQSLKDYNAIVISLIAQCLQNMDINQMIYQQKLMIHKSHYNASVKTQIKTFLKLKLAFLTKQKKGSENVTNRKCQDLLQSIASQSALGYDESFKNSMDELKKLSKDKIEKQFDAFAQIMGD